MEGRRLFESNQPELVDSDSSESDSSMDSDPEDADMKDLDSSDSEEYIPGKMKGKKSAKDQEIFRTPKIIKKSIPK